jgi:hypothetical protein
VVIVIYMAALWSNDVLRPVVSTPLVGFDNYEVYDLVFTNVTAKKDDYLYTSAVESTVYRNQSIRYVTSVDFVNPLGITNNADQSDPTAESIFWSYGSQGNYGWIVMEGYGATTTTTPESLVFIDTYTNKIKPEIYAVQRYTPYGESNTDIIYTLFDEYKPLVGSPKISWTQLIINTDIRYTAIAQTNGVFTLEYWSHNYLEGHPKIDKTLDYRKLKIRLTKGELFAFTLYHPVAHSCIAASELLIAQAENTAPQLVDILAANRHYASTLRPAAVGSNMPPAGYLVKRYSKEFYNPDAFVNGNGTLIGYYPAVGWGAPNNPPYNLAYATSQYTFIDYRVLRATNQVVASTWGVDADVGDYPNISLAEINQWHFDPQPDSSNGMIVMDSIRTIQTLELAQQIADAIDAATYATDPATGTPRVANLGHLLEKVANFIGYRPEPNGTIDEGKESSTYARKEIDPKKPFPTGEYLAGRFGTKGMLMKRLPNKATATGWAPGGMVAVHDIPQMVAEMFDQTNTALNLQESTSIQIRDGGDLYKYPNQLSLLMEIATGQIQQRRQVREIWASSVVTQNTVNEVIGGLGLPTVSKSISINNQLIPYWGIQPSASLQREIATVGQNVGNVQGQIL